MPNYTQEEEDLLGYMSPFQVSPNEPVTSSRFRELKLNGWTSDDEKLIGAPGGIRYGLTLWWMNLQTIIDYWQAAAILTFSLRRPIGDGWFMLKDWAIPFGESMLPGPDIYNTIFGFHNPHHGHAIYLDPTGEIHDNPTILRYSGKIDSQGFGEVLPTVDVDITKPREIPQFPQFDDKIIERFHRSNDPEMQEYKKAIGDWSALMHNAISQLA
jgi:hypothetical protein